MHQNLERKIEELELINYLHKANKMNSKGEYIDDFQSSDKLKKVKFGIDILDTRLVIRTNNTWVDTSVYSISLAKTYIRTASNIITKYTSNGSIVVDMFQPHKLEAFVFSLEVTVKVPTYTKDDRLNEFEEKIIEVASLPYVPIIDTDTFEEEDSDFETVKKTVYTFRMMNIDSPMEINPQMSTIQDGLGEKIKVDIMTTLSQKEEGDSVLDDEDLYAKELKRIKEAPTKRLIAQNEKLQKQFKELQKKKREENKEVEFLRNSIDTMEEELRNTQMAFEAHKKKEASPLKQKYENHYKQYLDRVSELEKMKGIFMNLSFLIL